MLARLKIALLFCALSLVWVAGCSSGTQQIAQQTPDGSETTEPTDSSSQNEGTAPDDASNDAAAAAETTTPTPAPTPIPTVGSYGSIADFVGSPDALSLARGLRNRLVALSGCTAAPPGMLTIDPGHFDALVAAVPDQPARNALTSAIAQVSEADQTCASDSNAWAAMMRSALNDLVAFESAVGSTPVSATAMDTKPNESADLTLLTSDIVSMNDRLYSALTSRNPIQASNVWWASSHLAHARGLRSLAANGAPVDALMLGDSTMAFLAPPVALTDATGLSIANVAVDGSRIGTQAALADEFISAAVPDGGSTTVVWGLTTIAFFRTCPSGPDSAIDYLAVQNAAFAPIPELAAVDPLDRLLGSDPVNPSYGGTTLAEEAATRHPDNWVYGARAAVPAADNPDARARQVDRWASTFDDPSVCDAEFAFLEAEAADLRARGHRVVLLAMPLSDDLTAMHPDGRAAHQAVVDRIGASARNVGVEFVDFSSTLTNDQFRDLTHVNTTGSDAMRPLLAELFVVPS